MTAKKKDSQEDKSKVFDVAKPGESAPSASSRPIIVQHPSGRAQDPMVKSKEEKTTEDSNEQTETNVSGDDDKQTNEKKVIAPISEDMVSAENEEDTEEQPKETPEPEKTEDSEAGESSESGEVDALAQEVNSKKQLSKEEEEAKKKQEALQKIIDSKQYFVPIGEEAHRKGGRKAIIVGAIVLIVILIAANLALDAELVDANVEPFTNFL